MRPVEINDRLKFRRIYAYGGDDSRNNLVSLWGIAMVVRVEWPWAFIKPYDCWMAVSDKQVEIKGGEFKVSLGVLESIAELIP